MTDKHWAYCPDRNGVCAIVVADAERAERDAERIAELGEELQRARGEVQRLMALHNSWVEAARVLREEVRDVDHKRSRLLADCRDLERENASLRRRLREGGR